MANMKPDLSIVIVTYDEEDFLLRCLTSIYKNNCPRDFEIIVVDNGSESRLSENLKKRFPDVLWIENRKNLGFAKAVDQGFKRTTGRYIMVSNSDIIFLADSIFNLVRFMDNHKTAGAAGGKILTPQATVQPTCRRFPTYLTGLFNRTSLLTKLFPGNRFSRRYLLSPGAIKTSAALTGSAGHVSSSGGRPSRMSEISTRTILCIAKKWTGATGQRKKDGKFITFPGGINS